MKYKALAIVLAATMLNAGAALADYRLAPTASSEERQRYEQDHVAAGRYHRDNAQARMPGERVKQPLPFTENERRWFNQSKSSDYGMCDRPTNFPCN